MAWFYYSFDFVINSFTRLSERQTTWWQIALKCKAYRFKKVTILSVCERAVVLWGSKLSNKPYFTLKLWYREERPFGIQDSQNKILNSHIRSYSFFGELSCFLIKTLNDIHFKIFRIFLILSGFINNSFLSRFLTGLCYILHHFTRS